MLYPITLQSHCTIIQYKYSIHIKHTEQFYPLTYLFWCSLYCDGKDAR